YFVANQTVTITLRNLENYETIMADLINAGANNIQGVEFKSTQTDKVASEIRAKAVLDAKKKAQDYAGALNQSIGKALIISDQSYVNVPRVYAMKTAMVEADAAGAERTLALAEIEISITVNVVFELKEHMNPSKELWITKFFKQCNPSFFSELSDELFYDQIRETGVR